MKKINLCRGPDGLCAVPRKQLNTHWLLGIFLGNFDQAIWLLAVRTRNKLPEIAQF